MKAGRRVASIVLCVLICCVSFSGCAIMKCYEKLGWEQAYDYFTSEKAESRYRKIKATIFPPEDYNSDIYGKAGGVFNITVDEKDYEARYGESEKWRDEIACYYRCWLKAHGRNHEILKENGFYELDIYSIDVYFTSIPVAFWSGWICPVVGVQVGETVYLDEETGKANWLEYIKEQIQECS
ncbi:MAG: hypothetical protein NC131_18760 [Roseburia sp.]|nr:hypothetical protein [Roseburia sp.]